MGWLLLIYEIGFIIAFVACFGFGMFVVLGGFTPTGTNPRFSWKSVVKVILISFFTALTWPLLVSVVAVTYLFEFLNG